MLKSNMKTEVIFFLLVVTVLVSGDEYHPNFPKLPKKKAYSGDKEDKVEGRSKN